MRSLGQNPTEAELQVSPILSSYTMAAQSPPESWEQSCDHSDKIPPRQNYKLTHWPLGRYSNNNIINKIPVIVTTPTVPGYDQCGGRRWQWI